MSIGPYGPNAGGGGGTSLTPPVQAGAGGVPGGQAGFIALAKAKIQQMIGPRYYLIDDATLTGIATKLWNSVALQELYAGYQQSPAMYGASLEAQIQATILNP